MGRHLNGIRMTLRLSKRLCLGTPLAVAVFEYSFQSSKIDRFLVQKNRLIEYPMLYFPSSDAIIFHVSRTMSIDHEIYQVSSRFGIKVEASIERYFDG